MFRCLIACGTPATKCGADGAAVIAVVEGFIKTSGGVDGEAVHVDLGLAFVRADANTTVEGEVRSNNVDYFPLNQVNDDWKIVNASHVSKPVAPNAGCPVGGGV